MMVRTLKKIPRVWYLAGSSAAALLAALFITVQVIALATHEHTILKMIDEAILTAVAHYRTDVRTVWAVNLTALGSPPVLTLLTIFAAAWLFLRREMLAALHILVAALGAGALTVTLKGILNRARPEILEHLVRETSLSFPSGHALASSSIYFTLTLIGLLHLKSKREKAFITFTSVLLIVTVAFSRVYLAVHYPSDVLAGTAFGFAWALALAYLLERSNLGRPTRSRESKQNFTRAQSEPS